MDPIKAALNEKERIDFKGRQLVHFPCSTLR